MKRKGHLYDKICTYNNIDLAELKARKGKSKRDYVTKFNRNRDENIQEILNELRNKTFKTSEYSHFIIYEPKKREISKLPYKDRVIHHALMNIIEPILKDSFIAQTYSCIKRRGIHRCQKDLKKGLLSKSKYCLKLDINKFYPSVKNDILKKILRTKFKDKDLLYLLDNIIDSHIGLPLGSYTSQWFANLYLNKFDHWLKQTKNIKYYYRYCDDIVILGDSKEELHSLRVEIQNYLRENLKLELSNYQIFPIEKRGIDFVGYKFYHKHILLRDSIKRNFIRMMRRNKNQKSINSYNGWLKHCNSMNLRKKYLITI